MTLSDAFIRHARELHLRLQSRFTPLIWPLDNANDNSPRLGGAA